MKYSELREKVERGARFTIDFKKRTLRVNGKLVEIDDNGIYDVGIHYDVPTVMEDMEKFYNTYKHSIPSARSEKRQRNYFKALPYEQLSDDELCYGQHRETARFDLEFFILRALQLGRLTWQKEWGTWFWQSDKDKDLVILREWVEPQAA